MLTYLCAWTISDPPYAVDIADQNGLKYKRCHMGWWDHCVSAGMKCYSMRCAHNNNEVCDHKLRYAHTVIIFQ